MITIYTGCPGSGKSLFALSRVVDELDRGRSVYIYQDIYLSHERSCRHHNLHFLDNHQALVFWQHVQPGSLVVLDEFHILAHKISREEFFRCWFNEHHFAGTDLLLISQYPSRLASFFLHRVSEPAFCKAVNPDIIFNFQHLPFFGARSFRLTRHGAVDSSYVYFGLESTDNVFLVHWLSRRSFRPAVLMRKISRFFKLEASK